jgi:hypothetical protein
VKQLETGARLHDATSPTDGVFQPGYIIETINWQNYKTITKIGSPASFISKFLEQKIRKKQEKDKADPDQEEVARGWL